MKQRIQQCVIVFSVLGAVGLLVGATRQTYQGAKTSDRLTLRAQAERTGGRVTVRDTSYHRVLYHNIKSLTQDSDTILTGTVLSNECVLTEDGMSVNTNY